MCAPRYVVVTGDAPEESINKFLEDYLPDGWGSRGAFGGPSVSPCTARTAMKGLHQFRQSLDLSKLKSREKL